MKKLTQSVLLLLLFAACAKDKQQEALAQIKTLEAQTYSAPTINPQFAQKIIEQYNNYANNYPSDTANAVKFLLKAGEVANALNKGSKAVEIWNNLLKTYPNSPKAPHALFMIAFAYENTLHETANAQRYYEQFLQKYPNHVLAKDAKAAIDNLGKTPEELVKAFEARK